MHFFFNFVFSLFLLISCSAPQVYFGRSPGSVDSTVFYPAKLPGQTGVNDGQTRYVTVKNPPGYMTYGPYQVLEETGRYLATFALSVDNNTSDNGIVSDIDVFCNTTQNDLGGFILAYQSIRRKDFVRPGVARNFDLVFTNPGCDRVEYRVWHRGISFVRHHETQIKKIRNSKLTFAPSAPDSFSATGKPWGNTRVVRYNDRSQFLTYGPYTTLVKKGRNRVYFSLAVDNNSSNNQNIAWIDVYNSKEKKRLAFKEIYRKDFRRARALQNFTLEFNNQTDYSTLEFRVYFRGGSYLMHANTEVEYMDTDLMNQLWKGEAQLSYKQTFTFPEVHTSSLVVKNGKWYAFNRNFPNGKLEVVVRESADKGVTWSDAFVVATPKSGTGYSEHITDGSAYFDEDTGRWHYITQCMAADKRWKMCHFYRDAESPLGEFTPNQINPVVHPGQLWRKICDGKNCPNGIYDEGTPEIHYKEDGYFWVSFHGYLSPNGYRGLAKTKDFVKWELPANPLLATKKECSEWMSKSDGGCIGVGHTATINAGGYFYSFMEASSKSLACTKDQEWLVGLVRRSVLNQGVWEQYRQNPVIKNLSKSIEGCSIQYHRIFRDHDRVYIFMSYRAHSLTYKTVLYELTSGYGNSQIVVGE
jgi:hypothetical protein